MTISNLATCLRTPDLTSRGSLVDKVSTLIECLCKPSDGTDKRIEASHAAERAFDASIEAEKIIADLLTRVVDLEHLVQTDELTGLLNRRGFEDEFNRALSSAERHHEQGVLIYIDLDGFKPVNDTFGHAAGDDLLAEVGSRLRACVRQGDVVARLGGDEFAVILSQADTDTASEKAVSLVEKIEEQPLDWNGEEIPIQVSYGLYTFRGGDTAGDALAAADRAMYEHKMAHKKASSR